MLSCLVMVCVVTGCKGGTTTPTDPSAKATFTVDGQAFQPAAKGMTALDTGSGISVTLSNCGTAATNAVVNLSLRSPLAVGTVATANILDALFFNSSGQWNWVRGQGRGSVILTSVSPRIVGTFEFDLQALAGTGATGTKYMNGSFDVTFGNGSACK